jgi:hypothetical protein
MQIKEKRLSKSVPFDSRYSFISMTQNMEFVNIF